MYFTSLYAEVLKERKQNYSLKQSFAKVRKAVSFNHSLMMSIKANSHAIKNSNSLLPPFPSSFKL